MITPSDMPNGPVENILDTCITNTSISIQKLPCGKDESKMYKPVFGLIGRTNSNPMPPNISDESLADGFSSFFTDNIITICRTLDNIQI